MDKPVLLSNSGAEPPEQVLGIMCTGSVMNHDGAF